MAKNLVTQNLIDEFISYLRLVENKSANTLSSYRRDLNHYIRYKKNFSHLLFQEYLTSKKLAKRSQSRVISAVRSYFNFLKNKGFRISFKERLHGVSFTSGLPYFVTHKEFDKILQASLKGVPKEQALRNQVVLYLLFGLGCRVSEVTALFVQDYIETDESIIITGKGNKQRILPVTEPLLSYLKKYILEGRQSLMRKKSSTSLILNNRGGPTSRVDIWRWIKKFCAQAFVSMKSPHQFRHGCATELLDHGADLRSIQELLGHRSIETTRIYTKITRKKMRSTIQNHHLLSK